MKTEPIGNEEKQKSRLQLIVLRDSSQKVQKSIFQGGNKACGSQNAILLTVWGSLFFSSINYLSLFQEFTQWIQSRYRDFGGHVIVQRCTKSSLVYTGKFPMYKYLLEVPKWIIFFQLKSWQELSSLVSLRNDRAQASHSGAFGTVHNQIKPWKPNPKITTIYWAPIMNQALCQVHYIDNLI